MKIRSLLINDCAYYTYIFQPRWKINWAVWDVDWIVLLYFLTIKKKKKRSLRSEGTIPPPTAITVVYERSRYIRTQSGLSSCPSFLGEKSVIRTHYESGLKSSSGKKERRSDGQQWEKSRPDEIKKRTCTSICLHFPPATPLSFFRSARFHSTFSLCYFEWNPTDVRILLKPLVLAFSFSVSLSSFLVGLPPLFFSSSVYRAFRSLLALQQPASLSLSFSLCVSELSSPPLFDSWQKLTGNGDLGKSRAAWREQSWFSCESG